MIIEHIHSERWSSRSEAVASGIKDLIIDNSLKPGDRLPTEHDLAEQFGVSRISVREATKALSFLGILRAAPRRGLTVGELDMSRVTKYLGFHFAINEYPREQLLDARIVIELGAMPYAAQRMKEDPSIYEHLKEIVDEPGIADDPDRYIEADIAFHRGLMEASGIAPLAAFDDLLHVFFNKYREEAASDPAHMSSGVDFHRSILAALKSGKTRTAQKILRQTLELYKTASSSHDD